MTLGLFLEVYQYLPSVLEKRGGEGKGGERKRREKRKKILVCRNQ